MKIIFFGSSHFAVASLKLLTEQGFPVLAVVTQPDRKCGRGLPLCSTSVKELALSKKLPVLQPENVNSKESVSQIKSLEPDILVVIAYGQILSSELLLAPKITALNIHASYLPRYRGAAPINWAIINGDKSTGITAIRMSKVMDAGEIIDRIEVAIGPDEDAVALENRLCVLAPELLLKTLTKIKENNYQLIQQNNSEVVFAPKLKKNDGLIIWSKPAEEIYNLIRGCSGWPGAFTHFHGKRLKVFKAKVVSGQSDVGLKAGAVQKVTREGILVACGKDSLALEELQIEGKRKVCALEFSLGHKLSTGEVLS